MSTTQLKEFAHRLKQHAKANDSQYYKFVTTHQNEILGYLGAWSAEFNVLHLCLGNERADKDIHQNHLIKLHNLFDQYCKYDNNTQIDSDINIAIDQSPQCQQTPNQSILTLIDNKNSLSSVNNEITVSEYRNHSHVYVRNNNYH